MVNQQIPIQTDTFTTITSAKVGGSGMQQRRNIIARKLERTQMEVE